MASLWTPEGEHRVPTDAQDTTGSPGPLSASDDFDDDDLDPDEVREQLAQMEQELLDAPVEAIIANHCYGFFQLAALHLSQRAPHRGGARLAIDALAAVVDGLGDRFGPSTETLLDA